MQQDGIERFVVEGGARLGNTEKMVRDIVQQLFRDPHAAVLICCAEQSTADQIVREVKNRLAGSGIVPHLRTSTLES